MLGEHGVVLDPARTGMQLKRPMKADEEPDAESRYGGERQYIHGRRERHLTVLEPVQHSFCQNQLPSLAQIIKS